MAMVRKEVTKSSVYRMWRKQEFGGPEDNVCELQCVLFQTPNSDRDPSSGGMASTTQKQALNSGQQHLCPSYQVQQKNCFGHYSVTK